MVTAGRLLPEDDGIQPVFQLNAVTDDRVIDRRRVSGLHVGAQVALQRGTDSNSGQYPS